LEALEALEALLPYGVFCFRGCYFSRWKPRNLPW